MVSFVTLFLGLIFGPQPIELLAGDEVASVRVLVDGATVAELDAPPWELTWDFGAELEPHELVAIAFDEEGVEIGRTRQRLNLPRDAVEASVAVRGDEAGQRRTADVSWESRTGAQPTTVRAEFDGETVAADDPTTIDLPPHDPEALHFLRVEVGFDDGSTSSSEVAFGGAYLDAVSSELLPLPVALEGRKKLPPAEKLTGWFETDAGPAQVLTTELGQAEILIVRSRSSVGDLRWTHKQEMSKALPGAFWRRSRLFSAQEWSLRLIWPISRSQAGNRVPFDLFPYSEPTPTESGSLVRWVTEIDAPKALIGHQRLADAVAVAGVAAAARSGRRIVVLILGQEEPDESAVSPESARGYLRALHVPLHVWSTRPDSPAAAGWGEVTDVSTANGLKRAGNALFGDLERQRVVWIAGDYLPQQLRLTGSARGVRLVH